MDMMWLEALLSSLLVALALVLLLHSPPMQTDPMSDAARYWSLSDRTAALAELGSDAGPSPLAGQTMDDDALASAVFPTPEPFCYRWQWLGPTPRGGPEENLSSPAYSDPACAAVFGAPAPTSLTLERGVWRNGRLRFLKVEQVPRPA